MCLCVFFLKFLLFIYFRVNFTGLHSSMPLETLFRGISFVGLTLNVKWFLFEPEAQGIDSCFDFNSEAYGTVLLAEKAIISIMTTLAPSSQQFALIVHVSVIRDIYFAGSVKTRYSPHLFAG